MTVAWHFATSGVTMVCMWYMLRRLERRLVSLVHDPSLTVQGNKRQCDDRKRVETCITCSRGTDPLPDDDDFLQVRRYDSDISALQGMLVGEWCYDKRLVTLNEEMTVHHALDEMHSARATCALLYASDQTLLGVLDTPDVVRYVLRATVGASSARRLLRHCVIAPANVSVGEVCKHLRAGLRYIAVCSSHSTSPPHQIVSQRAMASAIIDAAHGDDPLLTSLSITVGEYLDPLQTVLRVARTASAREAFELMSAYGITSLPIIDDGHACGVISATDVLHARHEARLLDDDVLSFVEQSRVESGVSRAANCIVSCRLDDDMLTVLRIMLHEEVHHVYVLDDHTMPVGVVSFVDILRCF